MFKLGDYVVCPGHGVGQVHSIEKRDLNGTEKTFYSVKIISNGMKVMVPTESEDGIRNLVTEDEISEVFNLLQEHDITPDTSTWNRRHRDYMAKVKTGSLVEIADVLRQLLILKYSKKLSFGEKKMLDQCKDLIVKEISISSGDSEKDIYGKIDGFFNG